MEHDLPDSLATFCGLAVKPGPELDALVADRVMDMMVPDEVPEDWHPSTDISAAWEVVEKIGPGVVLTQTSGGGWVVNMTQDIRSIADVRASYAIADTAPHAICLAALKAVGYEMEIAA